MNIIFIDSLFFNSEALKITSIKCATLLKCGTLALQ